MQYTHEHLEIQKTLKRYIDEHINPHVDEWEAAEIFPAHEVFKGLGKLGLLGLCKPEDYGGMGLDYSYSMLMAETLGYIDCGGVPTFPRLGWAGGGQQESAYKRQGHGQAQPLIAVHRQLLCEYSPHGSSNLPDRADRGPWRVCLLYRPHAVRSVG